MKRTYFVLCLTAASGCASPALAQTQAAMNAEASDALASADDVLNREWRETYALMKRRDADTRAAGGKFDYAAATLASQRAWLAFRDRECTLEGGEFAGGSLQTLTALQCRARMTNERSEQLAKLRW